MLEDLARDSRRGNYCRTIVLPPTSPFHLKQTKKLEKEESVGVRDGHLCPSLYLGIQHGTGLTAEAGQTFAAGRKGHGWEEVEEMFWKFFPPKKSVSDVFQQDRGAHSEGLCLGRVTGHRVLDWQPKGPQGGEERRGSPGTKENSVLGREPQPLPLLPQACAAKGGAD